MVKLHVGGIGLLLSLLTLGTVSFAPVSFADQSSTPTTAAAPEHPDTTFDKERFEREVVKSKDLPNFHEVHPFLYRGGAPTETGLNQLKERGVSTIIDLRGGDKSKDEAASARRLGLKYINLPMSAEPPTKTQVNTFIKTVKHAQAHPNDGSVFVHCAHGSDRAGTMVGIWRVTQDGFSYDDAYREMRHYWFTPKFTKLSGTVRQYAEASAATRQKTANRSPQVDEGR